MTKPLKYPKKSLYIGTSELIAKEAVIKGLSPSITLSDVYPAYFAAKNSGKWGIIEVNAEVLLPDSFLPWKKGKSWTQSLKQHGICLYSLRIPPRAILKIVVYNPSEADSNSFINETVRSINLSKMTQKIHQDTYDFNKALTRWFTCEEITEKELGRDRRTALRHSIALQNKISLELFFQRTEKDTHTWWQSNV